jgi:DNA repair exonuclease SbcCD ATPase subunit
LTALIGSNGKGKSVLLDALSFCLFGKPYRDIKIKELINRRNRKDLSVSCTFTVDDTKTYTLTRGIAPDILMIEQDGMEIDLLSSKKLNQVEIDKILGINYELFKQIISLSINFTKPFLMLKAQEKRDILEQIFNVKVIGDMISVVKKDNSDLRIRRDMVSKIVSIGESNISELKFRLDDIENAKIEFDKQKKSDILRIEQKIDSINKMSEQLNKRQIITRNTLSALIPMDVSGDKKKSDELYQKSCDLKADIRTWKQSEPKLLSFVVCPTCSQEIPDDCNNLRQTEIDRLTNLTSNALEEISTLERQIKDIKSCIDAEDDKKSKRKDLEYELKAIENTIRQNAHQLTDEQDNITSINEKTFSIDVEGLTTRYAEKLEEFKSSQSDLKVITDDLAINELVMQVLSEKGIKAYIFKKIVPVLNKAVNQYIENFGLGVNVTFDDTMEETIKILGHHDKNVSYAAFSEGEKKRIDMAILLSFIKITKYLANWNCNLLIVDELLDSSIDETGLEKLLESLRTVALESKNQSIVIISHRQEIVSHFDNIIEIDKNSSGFSTMKLRESNG